MTDMDDPPHLVLMTCAVCRYRLNAFRPAGGSLTWRHPGWVPDDHAPVAVPEIELPARQLCDFCSSPECTSEFICAPQTWLTANADGGLEHAEDGMWAACEPCAALLRCGDIDGLIERSIAEGVRMDLHEDIPELRPMLRSLYSQLERGATEVRR